MQPRLISGAGGLWLWLLAAGLPAQIVTFRLGDATASPGQTLVSVPLTVSVASTVEGGQPIAGLWATVRYDPAVLGAVILESARETVYSDFRDQSLFVQPGMVGLSVLFSTAAEPREANLIQPGTSAVAANLKFCLLASAPPGTYPLKFVDGFRDSGGDPFARTRAKTRFGDVYDALLESGSVTVAGESALGAECPADQHQDPFPEVPTGEFRLGRGSGRPGGEVEVPLILRCDTESTAFQLSIDFDEDVLTAESFETAFRLPDRTTDYDYLVIRFNNENEVPGSSGIVEGAIFGAVIFSSGEEPVFLPRNTDHQVLRFRFRIKEGARPGLSQVRFLDGARSFGSQTFYNQIVAYTAPTYRPVEVKADPNFVIINGRIDIVGDVTVFLRGDSNGDAALDISDSQTTLAYLFLGAARPPCLDACDANDDGALDLADPISTLEYLFLGGFTIPPPFESPGIDGTEDLLDC